MKNLGIILLFAGLLGLIACSSYASEAVFSKDGSRVYLVPYNEDAGIVEVDLDKKAAKFISLKASIQDSVVNLAVSKSGFILCATKKAVWAYDPAKLKCAKVSDFTGGNLECIAYDPKTEAILAATGDSEFALPKNGEQFQAIFNRRAQGVGYPVYSTDGSLFFEIHGDLWMGSIVPEDDASLHRYGTIAGTRVAPLAALETSECNASSTGIHDIALSSRFVYARYSRIGGSGWGNLIRFARPDVDPKLGGSNSVPDSHEYWSQAKTILGTAEKLLDCSGACYLCASAKGDLVFFLNRETGEQSKVSIFKNDEKPELIEISGLADVLGWK